ncbi:MAG TPA: hypothetical protein VGM92_11900 [Candidatus Kapabacteria bacterium]
MIPNAKTGNDCSLPASRSVGKNFYFAVADDAALQLRNDSIHDRLRERA